MESGNELRKRFILIPLALDHLVEQINQPSDDDDRRIDREKVDNFPHGWNLIILLVIDELALVSMINDTLLSKRQSSIVKVTTKSGENGFVVLVFAHARPNGNQVDPILYALSPSVEILSRRSAMPRAELDSHPRPITVVASARCNGVTGQRGARGAT